MSTRKFLVWRKINGEELIKVVEATDLTELQSKEHLQLTKGFMHHHFDASRGVEVYEYPMAMREFVAALAIHFESAFSSDVEEIWIKKI